MQRGRPRHDDILTPREWEVLDLLREGLTNEQLAERLGVSFATARFHVSEIISKLGVESREEAASWPGRPKRRVGLFAWTLVRRPERVPRAAAAVLIGAGLLAFLLLALGIVLMNARSTAEEVRAPSTPSVPEPVTETRVIDFWPSSTPSERLERET